MTATKLFELTEREHTNYIDMLVGLWGGLHWRHAGFGALQAYIREGEDRELRIHIWHPSLVKPGIAASGLCHDHRFDMRSSVLVGALVQIEFDVDRADDGDWTTHRVLHARAAQAAGGSFHADPVATGERYQRNGCAYTVYSGQGYTFDKFAFHETRSDRLTITLVEKSAQEDVNARILAPFGRPIVHAFTDTKSLPDFSDVLDAAFFTLRGAH